MNPIDRLQWQVDTLREENALLAEQNAVLRNAMLGEQWLSWAKVLRITKCQELMLRAMYSARGKVCTIERLSVAYCLHRPDAIAPCRKTLYVQCHRLRRALPANSIITEWGRGWSMSPAGVAFIERMEQEHSHDREAPNNIPRAMAGAPA